jgi:hypothetical protein
MSNLDRLTVTRLAIAKQLLSKASLAAAEPGTISPGVGVSLCQDGLELLLRAVADHNHVELPRRVEFEELISHIEKAGWSVAHKARLLQINRVRVSFKHSGNLPEEAQAKDMVAFASIAASEICQACIGVSLWDVTAVDLVRNTRVRNHLKRALELREERDYEGSCTSSAIAFALAYGELKSSRDGYRREMGNLQSSRIGFSEHRSDRISDLAGAIRSDLEGIAKDMNHLFAQVELLKVGIDLRALARFEGLVPSVYVQSNSRTVHLSRFFRPSVSGDDATFAVEFALDAILKAPKRALQDRSILGDVTVLSDTELYVSPPNEKNGQGEVILMAKTGETYKRPSHGYDRDGYLEVLFEGEPAYLRKDAVSAAKGA